MRPLKSEKLDDLLEKGLTDRVYPGAVLLVVHRGKRVYFRAVGHAALKPYPIPMKTDTIFDLASLTKPLATTLAMMKLVEERRVNLEDTLGGLLPGRLPEDKRVITLRLLLSHASGMADWQPFYSRLDTVPPGQRKQQVRDWIMDIPLISSPGREALYSDLGFMVLEWIIELKTGKNLGELLLDQWYGPLGLKNVFLYEQAWPRHMEKTAFAATEFCPRRNRILQGEVHDENAYAMGGYAGHAGLFGTAKAVSGVAGFLLDCYLGLRNDLLQPDTVRTFFTRQGEPEDTTWALGWDTPSRSGSSAGDCFSEKSVGHLGFTGTSLWMDLEKQVLVIFLTNRVHPSCENEEIKTFRPRIHNRVMEMLGFEKRRGETNG